jgi:hypothetical protein
VMAPKAKSACNADPTAHNHRPPAYVIVAKMPANARTVAAAAAAMLVLFTAVIQGDPFVLMWKKARDDRLRARRALEARPVLVHTVVGVVAAGVVKVAIIAID